MIGYWYSWKEKKWAMRVKILKQKINSACTRQSPTQTVGASHVWQKVNNGPRKNTSGHREKWVVILGSFLLYSSTFPYIPRQDKQLFSFSSLNASVRPDSKLVNYRFLVCFVDFFPYQKKKEKEKKVWISKTISNNLFFRSSWGKKLSS